MTSITIVTPSYNQAEYIRDTLDSVKNQTHRNVEHLVMDGGSTDGTLDILREYESHAGYDLMWISEPDDGQSDAINKGFERAEGDLVAWLNSDDVYFDVDVLSRVAEYFQQSEADIIYGDQCYIDQHSTVTAVDPRPDFDAEKLPYRILLSQPATFFRAEVVESERLDTNLQYSMDYEYWLRLSRRYRFEHVSDVFAGFRSYPEQKSQDQTAMADELQSILTEYADDASSGPRVVLDNVVTETRRLLCGVLHTHRLQRDPPELAFDGEIASSWRMLYNLGPGGEDMVKAWRRWRTGGASG